MSVQEGTPYQPYTVSADGISYGRAFNVSATSELDAQSQLESAGVERLAVLTDAYGNTPDPRIKCRSIEIQARNPARTTGTTGLYDCRAFYSSAILEPEPDGFAVWEIESSLQEVEVDVDVDGVPILNSANEPIEGIRSPRPNEIVVARFRRTTMTFFQAVNWSRQFRGRVNSTTWQGADAKEVLCHTLLPRQIQDDEIEFLARFEFKDSYTAGSETVAGWRTAVVDRGRRKITGTSGGLTTYSNILDDNGKTIQDPVLLDGAGDVLPAGDDPYILIFDTLPTIDFNTLGNL